MQLKLLIAGTIGLAGTAVAGPSTTGGGKAVVCRDSVETIKSARLLDLYEAVYRYGLTLREPVGNFLSEYKEFVKNERFATDDTRPFGEDDLRYLTDIQDKYLRFLSPGQHLAPTQDIGTTVWLPAGCTIEQVAVAHDDTGVVEIDTELWSALSPMDRAALVGHEEIYHEFRIGGEVTSENVRHLIGQLFSTTPPPSQKASVPAGKSMICLSGEGSSQSTFYMYRHPSDSSATVLQFTEIEGKSTIGPVKVTLPVVIDPNKLTNRIVDDQFTKAVTDPTADFTGYGPLTGGLFAGSSAGVRYKYGEPFSISLSTTRDETGLFSFVNSCYPPAK